MHRLKLPAMCEGIGAVAQRHALNGRFFLPHSGARVCFEGIPSVWHTVDCELGVASMLRASERLARHMGVPISLNFSVSASVPVDLRFGGHQVADLHPGGLACEKVDVRRGVVALRGRRLRRALIPEHSADEGFIRHSNPAIVDRQGYACGCCHHRGGSA